MDEDLRKDFPLGTLRRSKSAKSRTCLSISGASFSVPPRYAGLSRFVDLFERVKQVGEGTYGTVYLARNRISGSSVALKKIRMEEERDGMPLASMREISLLRTIHHDNIVKFNEVLVGNRMDEMFISLEFCDFDLANVMDSGTRWNLGEIKCLARQLVEGVKYLHHRFIIHRDLKLANLLLTRDGLLKIADFGMARMYSLPTSSMTPKVVTLWYRAPELLLGDANYTTQIDMWSVGCILGEFLLSRPFLPGSVEAVRLLNGIGCYRS